MDKKFLDRVLGQIVRETEIDYENERVYVPFISFPLFFIHFHKHHSFLSSRFFSFSKHCRDIYGLNYEETEYVWVEYREIIKDKIENNGL